VNIRMILLAGAVLAGANAVPAFAVTNLINNGSFEAGAVGTAGFDGWTKTNVPSNAPASIIPYNVSAAYPNGAFGESVPVADVATASPDAAGGKAAYFVGDFSVNESIRQLTWLTPGNFRVGFSYFLTQNGLNNPGNASFDATIVGVKVASTAITSASPARTWQYASGVGQIVWAGWYDTAFVFNSNLSPSKDIVVDQVFAIATNDPADVIIPGVPEPQTWAMLVLGFGLVGLSARRRQKVVAA
jgi:hypothetical protein